MENRLIQYILYGRGEEEAKEVANAVMIDITHYKGKPISELTSEEIDLIESVMGEKFAGCYVGMNGGYSCGELSWEFLFDECLIFDSIDEKEKLIRQTQEYIIKFIPVEVEVSPLIDID